jgi:KDO2-lipid IV(A) lauroyltransferase
MSFLIYSLAWRAIRLMPEKSAYRLGDWIARYAVSRNGKRVQRLRENLRIAMGAPSELALERMLERAMRSNLRYWIDTFRFPNWSRERMRSTVTVHNRAVFDDLMGQGNGLIVALPHAGNWDHAGAFFCAEGYPLVTVAEHLRPERLFRKFLAYREAMGMEVLDLDGRVTSHLEQRLREGRLIALVADRDLSATGVFVDFFARKAKFPPGPARLAINTGAPLITAYITYRENGIHVDFSEPISIKNKSVNPSKRIEEITQEIAKNFESGIRTNPQDWHMLQRVFIEAESIDMSKSHERNS